MPSPVSEAHLTPRESAVLALISQGATNQAAADVLGISRRTVEFHRANIMRKLSARNVSELIRMVLEDEAFSERNEGPLPSEERHRQSSMTINARGAPRQRGTSAGLTSLGPRSPRHPYERVQVQRKPLPADGSGADNNFRKTQRPSLVFEVQDAPRSGPGLAHQREMTLTQEVLIKDSLAASVMDALSSNICVVDRRGVILAVNRAWSIFSAQNAGGTQSAYVGLNYLSVCRSSKGPASDEAPEVSEGMRAVLDGDTDLFQIEYPCHSATEFRWFLARITPLHSRSGNRRRDKVGAVVSHMNITDRKLVELNYARLASTDPLTGLPNRRFLDEYAALEVDRCRRFGSPLSVLMLDLDKFKTINDVYGHAAGDAVLQRVAARCKATVRGSDLFARVGGEEFVGLLIGSDEAGAIVAAEKLRAMIEKLKIKTPSTTIEVTTSIGVSSVTKADRSIAKALARADAALYRAKSEGRNRVCSA